MNYIKLINAFWQIRRQRPDFDPYVITLFFALVNKANKEDWKRFEIYREDITAMSGMSPSAYYKARKKLQEAGLINYKEGASKISQCAFSIIPLYSINTEGDTEERQKPIQKKDTAQTEGYTEGDTILINPKTSKPLNPKTNNLPPPENENSDTLKAEPEKPKEKSSAKKEKVIKHLFRDSPFFDEQKFFEAFDKMQYGEIDLHFYYGAVLDWSESNGAVKLDWIATARGFMRRDNQEGKLKRKNQITNGKSTYTNQRQQSNGAGPDLEAAVSMSRLVVSDGYKQAG